MSWLSHSLLNWAAAAVALFWFVGAHNRLVRLRSAALQAYGALDALLVRQLDFVQASLEAPAERGEPPRAADTALQAAAGQALTVLGATRARPLDPAAMGALATALRVLLAAWERVHPDELVSFEADGTLSRPASLLGPRESGTGASPAPSAPMAWPEPSALVEITRAQFNAAVLQYNAAIRQFPAVFVAWAFRLRAAAPLV